MEDFRGQIESRHNIKNVESLVLQLTVWSPNFTLYTTMFNIKKSNILTTQYTEVLISP